MHAHASLLQEITQSPTQSPAAAVVMTFLIVTVTLRPGRVIENLPVVLVRGPGINHVRAQGKSIQTKTLNQQFDLAESSFWKLRGRVCILFCSLAYQQEPQSIARSFLEYLSQTWEGCS